MKRQVFILICLSLFSGILFAQPYELEEISWLPYWGGFNNIALNDDSIAVVTNNWGLLTFDISDPANPELLDQIPIEESWNRLEMQVDGDMIIFQDAIYPKTYVIRFSIADPGNIVRLPELPLEINVHAGSQHGDYFYASRDGSLYIFDTSNPFEPVLIDTLENVSGWYHHIEDGLLFAGWGCGYALNIISLDDPVHPEPLGEINQNNRPGIPHRKAVKIGDLIFQIVLADGNTMNHILQCIDISNLSEPFVRWEREFGYNMRLGGKYNEYLVIIDNFDNGYCCRLFSVDDPDTLIDEGEAPLWLYSFAIKDNLLFNIDEGVLVYDITDIDTPVILGGYYTTSRINNFCKLDGYLTVSCEDSSLSLFDISDIEEPVEIDKLRFRDQFRLINSWQDANGNKYLMGILANDYNEGVIQLLTINNTELQYVSEINLNLETNDGDVWQYLRIQPWSYGIIIVSNVQNWEANTSIGNLWSVSLESVQHPVIIGHLTSAEGSFNSGFPLSFLVEDDYIYLPSDKHDAKYSYIVSIHDPSQPEIVYQRISDTFKSPFTIRGQRMYSWDKMYNLDNPEYPEEMGNYVNYEFISGMALSQDLLCVVDNWEERLDIFNITDPDSPDHLLRSNLSDKPAIIHLENGIFYTLDDAGLHILRLNGWNGVEVSTGAVPSGFSLYDVYPNPFNSSAVISYSLPSPGLVSLNLFDLSGRRIRTLADCMMQAGDYRQTLNAVDMPSGSYFIRLNADGESAMKKVMLVK